MADNSATVRRRMRPADRARQLLRSAEEVFADIGFHAATMDDIARRAGVTRTILYQHYSSKDDLAAVSLAGSRKKLHEIIGEAATVTVDPRGQLQAILRNTMAFISAGGPLYSALLSDGALVGTNARRQAELIRGDVEALVTGFLLEVGYEPDEPAMPVHATAIVGAVERVAEALAAPPAEKQQTNDMADAVLELIWHGIQSRRR